MAFSRVLFAGAFNKTLPGFLEKVHPKYATPHWAIITLSIFAVILACSGGYRYLIVVATISMMLSYVGVALALIKFKLQKETHRPAGSFRIPGGIIIPVISLVALGWFLWHSKKEELVGIGVFIGALIIIYLKMVFKSKAGSESTIADSK
jgi:amino acid transporter